MSKGVVWSLFDGSGLMVLPWAEAGYTCFCFNADEGDHGEYVVKARHHNITYVNCWIEEGFDPCGEYLDICNRIDAPNIIFSFPQCTNMANSGSKHERDDEVVDKDVALAKVAQVLGEKYGCTWLVENPVGKLCTKWRKPDHYFDPYEYGGYLSPKEGSFHKRMPAQDGYTKKTCLWVGNGFIMPDKRPVEHIGFCWSWKYCGGKGQKTKQLRSLTPRGFARAVFEANRA